jgi:hypothetical protein
MSISSRGARMGTELAAHQRCRGPGGLLAALLLLVLAGRAGQFHATRVNSQ